MTTAPHPLRTVDRLRVRPRAGIRARRPREIVNPPSTEANTSLPRSVVAENTSPRPFPRKHRTPSAASASLAYRPRL